MSSTDLVQNSGLTDIRVEQARLLQSNAAKSALIVTFIVLNTAIVLSILGVGYRTGVWVVLALMMVVLTVLYARFAVKGPITQDNVATYLRGHVVLSACTGLIWSGFAVWAIDVSSEVEILIFTILIVSITIGGLLPGSIYRPGYVALATTICLPLALSLLFSDIALARFIGLGLLVYYLIALLASVQNEVTIRDGITARLNADATAKIAQKNVEIERLMGMKSSFLASISHDLSQPLLAQRNFLRQLEETGLDARQKMLLENLKATQSNQERLFQDLSDMNVEGSTFFAQISTFDLFMVLANTLTEFEGIARTRNLTLEHQIDSVLVQTDAQLLARMVRNLLSNAMKFTPSGGNVSVVCIEHESKIGLRVSDTGVGIAPENMDQIFETYVQFEPETNLHETDEQTRTSFGLGLSIVRKFARLIGAELEAASVQGKGTDITIWLPKAKSLPEDQGKLRKSALLMFMVRNKTLLLEPTIEYLSMQGHRTLQVSTVDEAIGVMAQIDDIPTMIVMTEAQRSPDQIYSDIALLREEVNENVPTLVVSDQDLQPDPREYKDVYTIGQGDMRAVQDQINDILSKQDKARQDPKIKGRKAD